MSDSTDPFATLDRSIANTAERAQLETEIYQRVRTLMRENGLTPGYCEQKALEQATIEIIRARSK